MKKNQKQIEEIWWAKIKRSGSRQPRSKPQILGSCYTCGKPDHTVHDPKYPARNDVCRKCNIIGHYAAMCKTKQVHSRYNKGKTVSKVSRNRDTESSGNGYMFGVTEMPKGNKTTRTVVEMKKKEMSGMIDRRSSVNNIDENTGLSTNNVNVCIWE